MSDLLPSIYNSRGVFQPLPTDVVATLDDGRRATYAKIERAAADLKIADDLVAAAIAKCKAASDAVVEFKAFADKEFPKLTFQQLWKENFAR